MSTVFISRRLFPDSVAAFIPAGINYRMHDYESPLSKVELIQHLQGANGLICLLNDNIDRVVIEASPSLRVISNIGAGYNNIDVTAATAHGIIVTNTPGVQTETTADLAFALMICVARRIIEADKSVRAGSFDDWKLEQRHSGTDLYGKTLGIVGMGHIGLAVARRGNRGFGMPVIYYSSHPNKQADEELGARPVSMDELLATSDFISIHVPLTEKTRYMFRHEQFNKMKKDAFIINTSRGPVIDENALADALLASTIKGAALDVYEHEPAINSRLLKIEHNLVLTPHIGSATLTTRTRMAQLAVTNMISALQGHRPPNMINEVHPL